MIYDPSRRAQELRQRVLEGMSEQERAEYNRQLLADTAMAIRICEKCGEPRVLEHLHLEAQEGGGTFTPLHHLSVSCGCGLTSVNDADVEARPDLFIEPCRIRQL